VGTHRTARELRTVGRPFTPGHDPRRNEGGRPKLPEELKATIAALTEEMILGIADLARTAQSESVKLEAQRYLVDRRLGRPVETTKIDASEGMEPPTITIRTLPVGRRDGLHG